MARLKNIWKGSGKHKKLPDEWNLAINEDFDGDDIISSTGFSTYKVKYLGHIPVDLLKNTEETARRAIDSIISLSKANTKRIQKVMVTVNIKGIEVTDCITTQSLLDVSIFRICSCLAYAKSKRVFAFLATDAQETTECHAFLCPKRSVAENLAITVAQMFSRVYSMCQTEQAELFHSLQYNNTQPPSYLNYDGVLYKDTDISSSTNIYSKKSMNNGDNVKETSLFSTSPLAYAEVYTSPGPVYSEKSNGMQRFDIDDWSEDSGEKNNSIELIVF